MDEDIVILVFNDDRELPADRRALARSGFYFRTLLNGCFMEAKRNKINMTIDYFSYDTFQSFVKFAETKSFDNQRDYRHYLELIQLARMFLMEDLVNKIENQITDFVDLNTIATIHFLANKLCLPYLIKYCEDYGSLLDLGKPLPYKHVLCSFEDHKKHHYLYCGQPNQYVEEEPDPDAWRRGWHRPSILTPEESLILAEEREKKYCATMALRRKIQRMNYYSTTLFSK